MGTFVQRLASRKFLLAVAAALTAIAAHQWAVAGAAVVVYIAGEAHIDAKAAAANVADVADQLAAAVAANQPPPPAPATPFTVRLDQSIPAPFTVHPAPGTAGPASVVVTSTQPVVLDQAPEL